MQLLYFGTASTSTPRRMDDIGQKLAAYCVHLLDMWFHLFYNALLLFYFYHSRPRTIIMSSLNHHTNIHTWTYKIKLWLEWKALQPAELYFPEGLIRLLHWLIHVFLRWSRFPCWEVVFPTSVCSCVSNVVSKVLMWKKEDKCPN